MSEQTLFKHIDVAGTLALLDNQNTKILDIRDPQSYAMSHITGAIHLHNDNIQTVLGEITPDSPVVVCCYHGVSSQNAANYIAQNGFTEVYSLDGGFEHWKQVATDKVEP